MSEDFSMKTLEKETWEKYSRLIIEYVDENEKFEALNKEDQEEILTTLRTCCELLSSMGCDYERASRLLMNESVEVLDMVRFYWCWLSDFSKTVGTLASAIDGPIENGTIREIVNMADSYACANNKSL